MPVGENIVTRRPLELNLNHIISGEPYATFNELQNKTFKDFSKISEIIQALTEEECKSDKGYSSKPIILNIYSKDFPNVTFIDLPGTTYIPLGECPTNYKLFPTNLASKYIEDPLNLILCVIPGKSNILDEKIYSLRLVSQRESLIKSFSVIGVITKLDLKNEEDNNILEILSNKYIPIKFGYVGIKNRSLKDLINKINLEDSLKSEKKFFEQHYEIYKSVPKDSLGYDALINKLKKTYFEMIKENLEDDLKLLNEKIIKEKFIENYNKKKSKIEILKFINKNSFKENDSYDITKKSMIKIEKKEDCTNLMNLLNFINENA